MAETGPMTPEVRGIADMSAPPTTQDSAREWATIRLRAIERVLDADVLTIISPINWGLEHGVKAATEAREERGETLAVILDTPGGVVEVVERIVRVLRHHYAEVKFIIPDKAMSAGTVLAMSGDDILMDYHSCLGPIDPQLEKDGRLVPALSYLSQFEALIEKSHDETLSTAEVVLLQKLDLAELHQLALARDLSINLLEAVADQLQVQGLGRDRDRTDSGDARNEGRAGNLDCPPVE